MIEHQLRALATFGGGALVLSVVGVLAFGAVPHAERRWRQQLRLLLLPLIILGVRVTSALSGRVANFESRCVFRLRWPGRWPSWVRLENEMR